jgi:hypothetical protein
MVLLFKVLGGAGGWETGFVDVRQIVSDWKWCSWQVRSRGGCLRLGIGWEQMPQMSLATEDRRVGG